ncbi:helix-turn-helix domain-containing protein [Algoriphagus namhaensis]
MNTLTPTPLSLNLNLFNLIYLASTLLGFVIGLVMISFGAKKNKTNVLMGLAFTAMSWGILLSLLVDTRLFVYFPALYRTGNLGGMIYAPLPFLYISFILYPRKFRWYHLLHFLPALVYFIDFWPVYLLSIPEKSALILSEIDNPYQFIEYSQSRFFSSSVYTPLRTLLFNLYWLAGVWTVWRYLKTHRPSREQVPLIRWIQGYLILQSILFVPFYFSFFTDDQVRIFRLIHFSAAVLLLSSALYLLAFPSILYGLNFKAPDQEKMPSEKDELPLDRIEEIKQALQTQIEEKKVHLKQGYSIQDLARDCGIPYYLITQYLNQNLGMKFNDFINQKRIEHCLELFTTTDLSKYTVEGIGALCGFKNRNSFTSAFKKNTGTTPSAYLKQNGETA